MTTDKITGKANVVLEGEDLTDSNPVSDGQLADATKKGQDAIHNALKEKGVTDSGEYNNECGLV